MNDKVSGPFQVRSQQCSPETATFLFCLCTRFRSKRLISVPQDHGSRHSGRLALSITSRVNLVCRNNTVGRRSPKQLSTAPCEDCSFLTWPARYQPQVRSPTGCQGHSPSVTSGVSVVQWLPLCMRHMSEGASRNFSVRYPFPFLYFVLSQATILRRR